MMNPMMIWSLICPCEPPPFHHHYQCHYHYHRHYQQQHQQHHSCRASMQRLPWQCQREHLVPCAASPARAPCLLVGNPPRVCRRRVIPKTVPNGHRHRLVVMMTTTMMTMMMTTTKVTMMNTMSSWLISPSPWAVRVEHDLSSHGQVPPPSSQFPCHHPHPLP